MHHKKFSAQAIMQGIQQNCLALFSCARVAARGLGPYAAYVYVAIPAVAIRYTVLPRFWLVPNAKWSAGQQESLGATLCPERLVVA